MMVTIIYVFLIGLMPLAALSETISDSASLRVESRVYFKSEVENINFLAGKLDCLFGGASILSNKDIKNLDRKRKAIFHIRLQRYLNSKEFAVSNKELRRLFDDTRLKLCGLRDTFFKHKWLKLLILQEVFFQENFELVKGNEKSIGKRWSKFLIVLSSRYKAQVLD